MRYSKEDIQAVDGISLEDVMEAEGRRPEIRTKRNLRYICPFHNDSDPSLVIEAIPSIHPESGKDYAVCAWHCHGCKEAGYGAISLYSKLTGLTEHKDMTEVVTRLSAVLNIVLPSGQYANSAWANRRHKDVDISEEIKYDYAPWTENHLKALGCFTTVKMAQQWDESGERVLKAIHDSEGNMVMQTEWDQNDGGTIVPIDTNELTRIFSIRPVDSYVTECREVEVPGSGKVMRSFKYAFSDGYPVFEFRFRDAKGWFSKKYEPAFKPHLRPNGDKAPNYKFTWWYEGGRKQSREHELSGKLYGDIDVMNAIDGGEVQTTCPLHPVDVSSITGENGEEITFRKFSKVIICSGPRDAMNVWYHSDAHVVYPHSESTEISDWHIKTLRRIASEIYVMYDCDKTGRKMAEQLCMRNLDIRLIELPKEAMGKVRSSRSGKPCKDASEYFENWESIKNAFPHPEDYRKVTSRVDFRQRMRSAVSMNFIESELHIKPKTKEEFYKYTIDVRSAIQVLSARGLMKAPKDSVMPFVKLERNIVEGVSDKQVVSQARLLLTSFISARDVYEPGMASAIATSNRLTLELMKLLPVADIDYHSCGEDYDYFFFRNGALRISKESIYLQPYSSLPFCVEKDSIIDVDYHAWRGAWPFQIIENKEVDKVRVEFQSKLSGMTPAERKKATQKFTRWERQNRFLLHMEKEMNDMPETFQFIFDTSRIKEFKKHNGIGLTDDDIQFQVAHFVNKLGALGYYLYRYRTEASQQMVVAMDYFRQQADLDSGRSGKTTIRSMIEFVRKQLHVSGKDFKVGSADFAKNFSKFRQNVHSGIFVDDVRSDITSETFYNVTQELTVKSVYEDQYTLRPEDTPKLMITQNRKFNLQSSSTLGRIYPMYFGDYYHEFSVTGDTQKVSPLTKFGHLILENPDDRLMEDIKRRDPERAARIAYERCFCQNLMAWCLQFYLNHQEVIFPPLDEDSEADQYAMQIDSTFTEWADLFFKEESHYGVLIPVQEMIYSYLSYKGNPDGRAGKVKMTENMAVRIRENSREFRKMLTAYCLIRHIANTPPQIIRAKQDRERGTIRVKHWTTTFDNYGRETVPRRFSFDIGNVVACRIFFSPEQKVYDDWTQIPAVPDVQPGSDWLMVDMI